MKCIYRNYELINSYILPELEITKYMDSRGLNTRWDLCIIPFPAQGILQRWKRKESKPWKWGDNQEKYIFLILHDHPFHELTGTLANCTRAAQY